MDSPQILILVGEESQGRRIEHELSQGLDSPHRLTRLSRLDEAEIWLDWNVADTIVVELDLPDARGSAVIERLRATTSTTPIVVISDRDRPGLAAAFAAGASDCIGAEQMDPAEIRRIAHYIAAHAQQARLRQHERMLAAYRTFAAPCSLRTHDGASLQMRDAALFAQLVERYGELLSDYLSYIGGAVPKPSEVLRALVEGLVSVHASAADLLDVHTAAVDQIARGRCVERSHAILTESRSLAIELMAELADQYRALVLAATSRAGQADR